MSSKRDELRTFAIEHVQKCGLSNLSFRTLADKVGVKSSSVHYYFPEKADLAVEILSNYTQAFFEELRAIDAQKKDPLRKLMAFIDIFERVLSEERLCLCGMLAAEVATLDDTIRKSLTTFFDETEKWIVKILEQDKRDGDHRVVDVLDKKMLARAIVSGLEGALLIDRVDTNSTRLNAQRKFVRSLFK